MTRTLAVDLAATSRNWTLPPSGREALRAATPAGWVVEIVAAPTISDGDGNARPSREALEAVRDAEVYFGFGISRPLFLAAQQLGWVHSAAAGVGSALFDELVTSPVVLTNSAGVHGPQIAEHVVAGVLYLLRGLDFAVDLHRAGQWDKQPFVADPTLVREVRDCRVLVIGAGGLGSEVATRFSALGARCVGVRRRPQLGVPAGVARVCGPDAIDGELAAADVVVLTAPLTATTRELMTAARLRSLPVGAIVVNVARGALLDEQALVALIDARHLRGAVLDVFREEPLPADSPLWRIRSILLTPHVSAVSPAHFWERQLALFLDNWTRWVEGRPLRNVVDKVAGY
ncbi:MAG: D-2-hydroxyacid dehydrogenase [Gemmatimonadaceae bacterium]